MADNDEKEAITQINFSNKAWTGIILAAVGLLTSPSLLSYYTTTASTPITAAEWRAHEEELRVVKSSIELLSNVDDVLIQRLQRFDTRSTENKKSCDASVDSLREKLSKASAERAVNNRLITDCIRRMNRWDG